MKGPSLHYDLRVLRVFCCDACGRLVQVPGNVTSHTCQCSDPPKFMRPLERPRTVSPDVSRFISPPDEADLPEVDEVDEIPYVPHVPVKPPPPARFANRRKLYDDTAAETQPAFGEGIMHDAESEAEETVTPADDQPREDGRQHSHTSATTRPSENTDRDRNRPRRRRGRGGSADSGQLPGREATAKTPRPEAERRGATKATGRINRDVSAANDTSSHMDSSGTASRDAESASTSSGQGEGRRRSRRRGRRRGPRPEGGSA